MELQGKDKQELQQELSEFLLQYYDGSFSRMACDYIHATGMTEEEVEALLEAMKKTVNYELWIIILIFAHEMIY